MTPEKTILCVDDNALSRTVIQKFIEHSPVAFKYAEAASGSDCLSWLSQNNADLIILDYSLGDMTGCDVGKMIPSTSLNPDVPIIMFSVVDHEDLDKLCDMPNVVKVVQKPYDMKSFHQDVVDILSD